MHQEYGISSLVSKEKIMGYAALSVAPTISLMFLDTGHSYIEFVITVVLFAIGSISAIRGLSAYGALYVKVLFGIPAAVNISVLLFLLAAGSS